MNTTSYFSLRRGGAGQVRTVNLRYKGHVVRIIPLRYVDGSQGFGCWIDGTPNPMVDRDRDALKARVKELIDKQEERHARNNLH
ncbi:MAG: hypothetical protein WB586_12280 [Chthoniobacterales bacterium]